MDPKRLRKIVLSAMFCALVFAATWIAIPVVIGNVNLGDGVLLLCAWTLGGPWAAVAAALGATLTDLVGGYASYAPGTFVIKALMAAVAIALFKLLPRLGVHHRLSRILSAVGAEMVMILGYFVYEALFLGYGLGAAASVPFNALQGAFAIVISNLVYELIAKAGLKFDE